MLRYCALCYCVCCATVCVVGLVVYVWRVHVCYALLPSGMSHPSPTVPVAHRAGEWHSTGGHVSRDETTARPTRSEWDNACLLVLG